MRLANPNFAFSLKGGRIGSGFTHTQGRGGYVLGGDSTPGVRGVQSTPTQGVVKSWNHDSGGGGVAHNHRIIMANVILDGRVLSTQFGQGRIRTLDN